MALLAAMGVALAAAGCGGSGTASVDTGPGHQLAKTIAQRFARSAHVTVGPQGRDCSTAVDTGAALQTQPQYLPVKGAPFGVVAVPGYAFVAAGRRIEVLSESGGAPQEVHSVTLPTSLSEGIALSPDGRYLLVAAGGGAYVVDVAKAERGAAHALLGSLGATNEPRDGAIEAAVSNDDRYAFVSLEYAPGIAVYRLAAAVRGHFKGSYLVGTIPTGEAPVGLALSPDGRTLYSTSEVDPRRKGDGGLSVIDVAEAEHRPAKSVVATVTADCGPVRVATSSSGDVVWVTARESDELLAFSAAELRSDPTSARLAAVRVGEAPVGLALVDNDSEVVVADSDRFNAPGQSSGLTVVSATAALAGGPAVLGTFAAEKFPREMAVEPGGDDLLVGNYESDTLEVLPLQDLAQPQEP